MPASCQKKAVLNGQTTHSCSCQGQKPATSAAKKGSNVVSFMSKGKKVEFTKKK